MTTPNSFLEAPIPRPLLWVGIPIAAVVLIALFVFLGFPYARVADLAGRQLSEASGHEISIGEIHPRITIGGPGFSVSNLVLTSEQRQRYEIDPLRLRPAWSLSWLRGQPALHVDLTSAMGKAVGTVVLGDEPGWEGNLSQLDLAQLPLPTGSGVALSGRLDADADLTLAANGPSGVLHFAAADGTLSHSRLPIDIEYTTVQGDIVLGEKSLAEIRELVLDGPTLSAAVTGNVARGQKRGRELLDLSVELQLKPSPMRAMLRGLGVALDADGRTSFSLGGTVQSPKLR